MEYAKIAIGWVMYLTLHSLLASDLVKAAVSKSLPGLARYYRLLYSVVSTVGLLYMMWLMLTAPAVELLQATPEMRYIGMVLASWGVMLVIVAFRHISGLAFLGLKAEGEPRLIREGLHAHMRHPIYSGTILILLGMLLYRPTAVIGLTVGLIFIYLPIGIYLEEKKLIRLFGEAYVRYRKEVKAVIPRIL